MKICYLGAAISPIVRAWCLGMEKRGHEVVLITSDPQEIEGTPQWVIGTKTPIKVLTFLTRMRQTKKLIHEYEPDVVHSHYAYGYGVLGAYAGYYPHIVTAMGNDIGVSSEKSFLIRKGVQYTMNRMNIMTVKDHRASLRAIHLGCEAARVMVLPSWCDTALFTPMARSTFLRNQWGVNSDTLVVLYVRPLNSEYRAHVLIDAIQAVLATTDRVKFLVTNRGDPTMVESAAKMGATIIPKIPHDRMHFYLASADISVDTYYPEFDIGGHGHGTNFVESMSSGTPVLVPDRPEYKASWMAGAKLYSTGDPSSLADAILSMLDIRERSKLGRYGREGVYSFASEKVCLDKMEKIYKELSEN